MAVPDKLSMQPHQAGNDGTTVFQLSNLDLLMPKLYVHMVEIFELPPKADHQLIKSTLKEGLDRTLSDYPILTGTLHFDNEAKRIVVKKLETSSCLLDIPDEEITQKALPSFSYLEANDFSCHLLDPEKMLPAAFVGTSSPIPADNISTDGPPVCGFQVTFIRGGLILGLAVSHQVCDGQGCEALLNSWSRHTMAATKASVASLAPAEDQVDPTTWSTFFGRKSLTTSGDASKEPMSQEAWEALRSKFPVMKTNTEPPPPPPTDFKMPVVKSRIWHFPASKLHELKVLCSEHGDNQITSRISTYDALLAVLWRAIVRAKQPLLQPAPTAPSKVCHAVNARGRSEPAIPADYIGAAVTMPQSNPPLTVADVLDGALASTLPILARNVRASTDQVTPEYVADLVAYAGHAPDLRWTELDMNWVLGLDCMAFSWHGMKSYYNHDFGFGTPAALRWPSPQFEGFFFVLPTRIAKKGSADEGLEIMLGLEESCYGRFEEDEELLQFAEQRGLGA